MISALQYHHPLPQRAVQSLRVEFSLRCHPALMSDNETLSRGNLALSVLINEVQPATKCILSPVANWHKIPSC